MIGQLKAKSESRFRTCGHGLLLVLALLTLASGCGRRHHRRASNIPSAPVRRGSGNARTPAAQPPAVAPGYVEEGIASWYGPPFNGRAAADGEIYDMETLVAAHRLLPFNTWLRVTNLANNKSVKVRVIDRGPFVDNRILDLSKAAARDIDLLGPGIGKIRLEVIAAPPDRPANDFYAVQVGAFSVRSNAEQVRSRLAARFGTAYVAIKQGRPPLWRVLVGKEDSLGGAQELAKALASQNKEVFVVRLDETITAPTATPAATPAGQPSSTLADPAPSSSEQRRP
ncbi:MAG: rare lipoprotein [Bryobacterales bacterium]|jgi:rare lipoprotein A|nr:rare lipoprotein [Bryobacterales bacterium]